MRIFGNVQFSFKTENGPKVCIPLKTIPSLADVSGPPAPSALLPYLEILYFLSYLFLHRSARHAHLSIFYVVEFPTGRNYMSGKHRLFDSCFWTQPPKTQQLIGVSLNSLWMERLRPLRGEIDAGSLWWLACTQSSNCRIRQLGICPDLGQLFLSTSKFLLGRMKRHSTGL